MKKVIIILLISANLMAFENPFDNKRINQDMIEIKKTQKYQRNEIFRLKNVIREQSEKLNGLISLNEGLSLELRDLRSKPEVKQIDNTELLKELGKMIDELNSKVNIIESKYLSKNEFYKQKKALSKNRPSSKNNKEKITGSSKSIYGKAVRLYYKKRYDNAERRFDILLKRKYKPASSNFFRGEIEYYSGNYESAIGFYKKSVSLSENASYMSMLLYHTAYSLEKTNQKDIAINFYQNLIDGYNDKYTILAEKRLKELKVR